MPSYLGPSDVILPFFVMNHEGFFLATKLNMSPAEVVI